MKRYILVHDADGEYSIVDTEEYTRTSFYWTVEEAMLAPIDRPISSSGFLSAVIAGKPHHAVQRTITSDIPFTAENYPELLL